MYTLKVSADQSSKRIDKLLAENLPQFPRAALAKLFDKELVWLNDKVVKPGFKLREGDLIKVDLSPLDIRIEDIDLPIIYQDENVLVIDKPSGVISHARGRYFDEPSVASFIRQNLKDSNSKDSSFSGDRAGIVHRLDRATSGVMITAKNHETLSLLQKQFSQRKVKKTYLAIIEGSMPTDEGVIDMPIGRNPKVPQTFHVTELGKPALTRYKTIKKSNGLSLLELSPETGRTHQLRVHLHELKHPILGDNLYSGKSAERLLLHASSLEITLPGGNRTIFTSPLPEEFERVLS